MLLLTNFKPVLHCIKNPSFDLPCKWLDSMILILRESSLVVTDRGTTSLSTHRKLSKLCDSITFIYLITCRQIAQRI